MESSERTRWVRYLLKREFEGHGWSKWLLTQAPAQFPQNRAEEMQSAKDAMDIEIAARRVELRGLPDDDLLRRGMEARIKELEAELQLAHAKAAQLEQESEKLRAAEAERANEEPLAIKVRRTLLCIIGGLAKGNGLELSEPYKDAEVIAAMMPDVRLSPHTIGNYLKTVQEAMDSRRT
ncbi:MAG: hypothetical protein ABI142_13095 [Bryocella sp.]